MRQTAALIAFVVLPALSTQAPVGPTAGPAVSKAQSVEGIPSAKSLGTVPSRIK